MSLLALVAAMVVMVGFIVSPPPRRRTVHIRAEREKDRLRSLVTDAERAARLDLERAQEARGRAVESARSILVNEWNAAFYTPDFPSRAESMLRNAEWARSTMERELRNAASYDETVSRYLATVEKQRKRLARLERRDRRREPGDLWLLASMCMRGARQRRRGQQLDHILQELDRRATEQ